MYGSSDTKCSFVSLTNQSNQEIEKKQNRMLSAAAQRCQSGKYLCFGVVISIIAVIDIIVAGFCVVTTFVPFNNIITTRLRLIIAAFTLLVNGILGLFPLLTFLGCIQCCDEDGTSPKITDAMGSNQHRTNATNGDTSPKPPTKDSIVEIRGDLDLGESDPEKQGRKQTELSSIRQSRSEDPIPTGMSLSDGVRIMDVTPASNDNMLLKSGGGGGGSSEFQSMQQRIEDLEGQLVEYNQLQAKYERVSRDNNVLRQEKNKSGSTQGLQDQLNDLRIENQQLQQDNRVLNRDYTKKEDQIKKLHDTLTVTESTLRQQINDIQQQLDTSTQAKNNMDQTNLRLNNTINSTRTELNQVKLEREKMGNENRDMRIRIEQETRPETNASTEVESLRLEVESLRQQLRMTENETTNQLTRMLYADMDSIFPDEEKCKQKMTSIFDQTHSNLCDDIIQQIEDDETLSENIDAEEMARQILFDTLMECFTQMTLRRNLVIGSIAQLAHLDERKRNEITRRWILPLIQSSWHTFILNRHFKGAEQAGLKRDIDAAEEEKQLVSDRRDTCPDIYSSTELRQQPILENLSDIADVIQSIYQTIVVNNYSQYSYLSQFHSGFEKLIAQCCEVCWIMVLSSPELRFEPTAFHPSSEENRQFNHKLHSPLDGSTAKIGTIVYYAWPAVVGTDLKRSKDAWHTFARVSLLESDDSSDDD